MLISSGILIKFVQVQVARTGDIVALGGLKDVITGETLCDEKAPIMLERMEFPDPVIKVSTACKLTRTSPYTLLLILCFTTQCGIAHTYTSVLQCLGSACLINSCVCTCFAYAFSLLPLLLHGENPLWCRPSEVSLRLHTLACSWYQQSFAVLQIAIEPKSKADNDKMGMALYKLAQEDPSFHFSRDEETNQTVIEGMGELHLDIIVDRMKREFNVGADIGAPQVGAPSAQ